MEKCKCGMPLNEETTCSCDAKVCKKCCKCPKDCTCGCKSGEKDGK